MRTRMRIINLYLQVQLTATMFRRPINLASLIPKSITGVLKNKRKRVQWFETQEKQFLQALRTPFLLRAPAIDSTLTTTAKQSPMNLIVAAL